MVANRQNKLIAKNTLQGKATSTSELALAVPDDPWIPHLNKLVQDYSSATGNTSKKGYLFVDEKESARYLSLDNKQIVIWAKEIVH